VTPTPNRHTRISAPRLRRQLAALAVGLWAVASFDTATPTWRLRTGQVKGTDFVHFYTLARLGAEGRADAFADLAAQREVQLAARPESDADWFWPAYGPQLPIALAPLGHLSYGAAWACWLVLTTAIYLALVVWVARRTACLRQHRSLVVLAALAFPPFWSLLVHGQLSVVATALIVAAWLALLDDRERWAGFAIGLLAYKPSLAAPAIGLLACAGAWRMLGPALIAAAGQVALAGFWVGEAGIASYVRLLMDSPRLAVVMASKPDQMYSWRAFWLLLVPDGRLAMGLYAFTAAATLLLSACLWRRIADPALRMALMAIAIVLASPHLYVYDLVLLAPAWMWLTDWYLARPAVPVDFGRLLYAGFVMPLVASAFTKVLRVQVFTLCLAVLVFWMWKYAERSHQGSDAAPAT
jgi:hypothetical protein